MQNASVLTQFVTMQIQHFSTVFNCFKFNSIAVTNIQIKLFNFKAFSINSTVLRPNEEFSQPPVQHNMLMQLNV